MVLGAAEGLFWAVVGEIVAGAVERFVDDTEERTFLIVVEKIDEETVKRFAEDAKGRTFLDCRGRS